ncbi:hypothetical protein P280DRAFT_498083 [Massarina eburnea CBS 473.64]|uniref:mRNA N(6)-methyladenine demethylase n=1 Tax=Massarina eburnea CBS 473.64 TaxID=1395130 RepID=A0A6A6S3E1_9PLEO|nr:hypothetical protein P280DRAFT_498083 [Massarina eburnea CBS 473.64]
MEYLDPHQRPPDGIRKVYKKYQKMKLQDLDADPDIVDLSSGMPPNLNSKVRVVKEVDPSQLSASFRAFAGGDIPHHNSPVGERVTVYEHDDMPGLHIIPSFLPPSIQPLLLNRLLHRDLSHPTHLTNIHTHYNINYPRSSPESAPTSFFSLSPTSPATIAVPIDPSIHRPITIAQLLNKKMRWMTIGGQYDWTEKRYPDSAPPVFPADIKDLLENTFSDTKAEAAIVNLYSPGDTLSVHRDVAETSATGLISVSLGCDAVFVIGTSTSESSDRGPVEKVLALRLRSGSAVYMSRLSRFAWHGVPQIVPGTCPGGLKDWPAGNVDGEEGELYENWRGWMKGKRVNLNVRQM